jgi:hypothetical protein
VRHSERGPCIPRGLPYARWRHDAQVSRLLNFAPSQLVPAYRTYNDSDQTNQAILFTSGTQYNVHTIPTSLGGYLQGAVRFPSCWDGVHVDSANHKSHVAYPDPALGGNTEGGMCPLSHPYALISIGAEFGFDLSNVTNMSSLVFANGDTTGYGFHADFVQGWQNSSALQASFANCFDNGECPWRAFGEYTTCVSSRRPLTMP